MKLMTLDRETPCKACKKRFCKLTFRRLFYKIKQVGYTEAGFVQKEERNVYS